jgi:hypothetical protein
MSIWRDSFRRIYWLAIVRLTINEYYVAEMTARGIRVIGFLPS